MVILASSRTIPRIHLLKSATRKLDVDIYDVQLDIGFAYDKCIMLYYCYSSCALERFILISYCVIIIYKYHKYMILEML